jgi:hypothetical protein
MANSFTVTKQSVVGDMRVVFGTLDMPNGNATAVTLGLANVYGASIIGSQPTGGLFNTAAAGSLNVTTAASGASFKCVVFGY